MDYQQSLDWLFSRVANYQKVGGKAYKPGLDQIIALCKAIGNPQNNFPIIHIAGTNGKGSVAHILASVLQENGYKVGLFSSPHIKDFRERIKINGDLVSKEFVQDFIQSNRQVIDEVDPSFFEVTTAMSFAAFDQNKVDVAIIETGLGGRLDATNIVQPILSIITNIGLEHTEYLGNTLELIAREKGGIIKANTPVVIGERGEVGAVFENIASQKNSLIKFAKSSDESSDLLGTFQKINIGTVICAVDVLKELGWNLAQDKIKSGIQNVVRNTGFMGRMQLLGTAPDIIADAAHNPDGIRRLMDEVKFRDFKNLHVVFAASSDKDLSAFFDCFPKNAAYYLTRFQSERAASIHKLELLAVNHELNYQSFDHAKDAYHTAQKKAAEEDLILICGSFFLLDELL